jgi:hypothetical protein
VTIHEPGDSNTGTIRLAAKAFGLYHFCTFNGGRISQGQAVQNQTNNPEQITLDNPNHPSNSIGKSLEPAPSDQKLN